MIANTFNKFFTTIADEIADLINPIPMNNLPDDIEENIPDSQTRFNISHVPLSEGEILDCIKELEDKKKLLT